MKVLLLAHAFPPYNASGAVRAAKLAEHLVTRGHEVRVLTARPQPYPETLATSLPDEHIIVTRWHQIEAPLNALRSRFGGRVNRAVRADGADGEARPSLAARAVVAYRSLVCIPDAQAGWIGPATTAGKRLLETWMPDLIYSTALPFSSHVAAARIARWADLPWVGEFRDLYSGNPYRAEWRLRHRADVAFERRIMASAAAVVSISQPLSEYLQQLHGKPAATIMNGYDPADFDRAPDLSTEFDPEKLTLVYTGIIYPGRRDPAILFEALNRLGNERRRFEVRFYGPALEGVTAAAARAGVGDIVRTYAPVPYLTSLGLQKAADALLLLLWDSPLERGVLTGKLFEYAGAGRPVLSLGCIDGAAAQLVRERGLGLATTSADEVAGFLGELARRKMQFESTRIGATDGRGAGLTRTEQFAALEAFLAQCGLVKGTQDLPKLQVVTRGPMSSKL